jgi:small subunit ribosomal protein S6
MFVIDTSLANKDWDGVMAEINRVFDKHSVKPIKMEKWSERKLAYPIDDRKRGTYILAYIDADTQVIDKLRRDFGISEQVLRVMFLTTEFDADNVPEIVAGPTNTSDDRRR